MDEKMDPKKNGNSKPVNLKLPVEKKIRFKELTHQRHMSMQTILSEFVNAFIDNPDCFKMKMEIKL